MKDGENMSIENSIRRERRTRLALEAIGIDTFNEVFSLAKKYICS